jgi:hypothetical protein
VVKEEYMITLYKDFLTDQHIKQTKVVSILFALITTKLMNLENFIIVFNLLMSL